MTTNKAIRLGKQLKYELILIFERYRGLSVKEIFQRLPAGYCSLKTLYNYHHRYIYSDRKAREIGKNF